MGREILRVLIVSGLVVVTVSTATVAATPPRPGTTESGLTESEEATLWSNTPPDRWETEKKGQTAVHEIASQTDLTFTEPPGTASRWNRYAHGRFQPGDVDESVHPESTETYSGPYIKDAHASIFSLTPSTWTYVDPDDTRLYAAPEGRLRGAVDYRIDVPASTQRGNWSHTWKLREHDIEAIRLLVDGDEVATNGGTHRPEFSYELQGQTAEITLEARIEATLRETARPPPESNHTTERTTHWRWVEVSNTYTVDVYDLDPTAVRVHYPDGREGMSIAQAQPWQGYTLDAAGEKEIRGVWRFFTARSPEWRRVVASSADGTTARESHALPVYVYAYPSAMAPRAKPEHTDPTILQTWGATHESPAPSLPEHVSVEVVSGSYDETYGMGVRADRIDPESVTVNGIVHGTETDIRQMGADPQQIRETKLSAEIIDTTEAGATVRVELEDAETGEPIELGPHRGDSAHNRDQSGYIELGEQRIRTNEDGQATVRVSDPGTYSVRYVPASWMDVYPAYAGDSASVRWHPLRTVGGWINLGIRFGLTVSPLAVAYYAGRRLASMFSVGSD